MHRPWLTVMVLAVAAGMAMQLFAPHLTGLAWVIQLAIVAASARLQDRGAVQGLAILVSIALLLPALLQAGSPHSFPDHTLAMLAGVWLLAFLVLRNPRHGVASQARQLQQAFAAAPIGVVLVDNDGRIFHANRAALAFIGHDASQLTGMSVRDFLTDVDIDNAGELLAELRSGVRSGVQFEKRFEHADGRELWALLYVSMVMDAAGRPQFTVVQVLDITARRRDERALRDSESRFRGITEHAADITFVIADDDTLSYTNPALPRLLGPAQDEVLGTPVQALLNAADRNAFQQGLDQARAADGQPVTLPRVRLDAGSDADEIMEVRLTGMSGNSGVAGVVANCRVITEQLAMERALRRNQARFATVFHASPDGILITRCRDGRVMDFNAAFARLTGISREQGLGRPEHDLGIWPTDSRVSDPLARARDADHVPARLNPPGGAPRAVEVTARNIEIGDEPCVLTVVRDVTDRAQAEAALGESEARFRRVFQESPDALVISGLDEATVQDVNRSMLRMTGLEREQLIGMPVAQLGLWGDAAQHPGNARRIAEQGAFSDFDVTLATAGGGRVPVLASATRVDIDGRPAVITVAKDMRELRRAEAELRLSEQRFRDAFEYAPIGMLLVDPDGRLLQANRFICELLNTDRASLTGTDLAALLPPEEVDELRSGLERLSSGELPLLRTEGQMLRSDGIPVWTNRHAVLQRDARGEPLYYIVQVADLTEVKNSQAQMERLAFYDTLTELANRRLFNDRLEQAVKRATRSGIPAALLYLDLDQFKRVNDTLGHDSGDALLKEVARRLQSCVRQEDTVGRPGGDEFTVLLAEVRDARAAGTVAEHILEVLRAPVRVAGHDLVVTTSIGITLTPDDGREPNQLTKNADLAMYRAKERGRNNYQFYAEDMNTRAMERLTLESELREGLARDQFELYFQPKVHLASRQVVGAEVLIRWRHPERGLVMPGEFIAVAEETGVINDIGRWVVSETCRRGARLQALGVPHFKLAVNISARQFRDPELATSLAACLSAAELDASWLELEITETMLMADLDETRSVVEGLRALGVKIAIDDFGTGHSSLNYLKRLPIHGLKVDRTFVGDIPDSSDDKAITAAVIAMAHELNLEVVAEGVETEAQLAFLSDHGCEFGQGFLFGAPQPFDVLADSLRPGVHKIAG